MRKEDKLHAFTGVAGVSALIAMILILSNLSVVVQMLSALAVQMPTSAASFEDIAEQIFQIRVDVPSAIDIVVLSAIAGLVFLAIASAAAASRMRKISLDIAID